MTLMRKSGFAEVDMDSKRCILKQYIGKKIYVTADYVFYKKNRVNNLRNFLFHNVMLYDNPEMLLDHIWILEKNFESSCLKFLESSEHGGRLKIYGTVDTYLNVKKINGIDLRKMSYDLNKIYKLEST